MHTVTESDRALLSQILDHEGAAVAVAIRPVEDAGGITMRADTERPGGAALRNDGRSVLLLDE